ncbi:DUF3307 domain-containing protein [Cyclobacterium plantarum]|uniref:DUF3307 domain-containing protein n=1 Tax=Cyclobacterium plantarum TaxID=2716263 RepID=A0ABX0H720_9BACT|nr:DUF3307 domain-containing protein [Cyclobacterium plantarum]NHE57429.1 DUF3307 domain-containing protein [Cyclobacterium plantarum]
MIILIKLILAHLLGDFVFQPRKWVAAKERKKMGAYQLYLHLLVHGLLLMLLVADIDFWPYALGITMAHGLIDLIKLYAQNEQSRRYWFFIDQSGHFLTLLVAVWYYDHSLFDWIFQLRDKHWLAATIFVFLSLPSSVIIKTIISRWNPLPDDHSASLDKAGQYIGILERWFVFVFIMAGRWEAIGFLVAAKSVFRFGDLRQSKDRKLTEYILIGTLLSFGLAILSGWMYDQF